MMEERAVGFLMSGISLSPDADELEACAVAASELKRAGVSPARLRFDLYKRSVDARKKDRVRLVFSVAVRTKDASPIEMPRKCRYTIAPLFDREMELAQGSEPVDAPPLVVGMGPAGLFCALLLAGFSNCWGTKTLGSSVCIFNAV